MCPRRQQLLSSVLGSKPRCGIIHVFSRPSRRAHLTGERTEINVEGATVFGTPAGTLHRHDERRMNEQRKDSHVTRPKPTRSTAPPRRRGATRRCRPLRRQLPPPPLLLQPLMSPSVATPLAEEPETLRCYAHGGSRSTSPAKTSGAPRHQAGESDLLSVNGVLQPVAAVVLPTPRRALCLDAIRRQLRIILGTV